MLDLGDPLLRLFRILLHQPRQRAQLQRHARQRLQHRVMQVTRDAHPLLGHSAALQLQRRVKVIEASRDDGAGDLRDANFFEQRRRAVEQQLAAHEFAFERRGDSRFASRLRDELRDFE